MHNRVGLGTFPLVGVFNKISPVDAEKLVRTFLDQGGYYIDTAPSYGFGSIETLLGGVLRTVPRDRFFLITKGGKVLRDDGSVVKSGKYEDVIRECDNSLRRLGLEYVDQYMIHSPDPNTPFSETMRAMVKLKQDGKVRELAVSNVTLPELREFASGGPIACVQNRYSLINRSIDSEFEAYLLENKISLLPYHLLEIGQLTGLALENPQLRSGDLRESLPYWNRENREYVFAWVRKYLAPLAKSLGITIGQLNMAWALSRPFIRYIVVGTTKREYIPINLKSDSVVLPDSVVSQLDEAYRIFETGVRKKYGMTVRKFRGLNEKFY